jgi:hypothetical protein
LSSSQSFVVLKKNGWAASEFRLGIWTLVLLNERENMNKRFKYLSAVAGTILAFSDTLFAVAAGDKAASPPEPPAVLTVQTDRPVRQMSGGMGASWHAIRVEFQPDSNRQYKYQVRENCPQGSAVAANPPLDSGAWNDIERLGRWLGLDWLRVEIDRRMYEPQPHQFNWKSDEMVTLYRILDWCESNGADVFLTEMWRDVEWLAYPGVHPLMSAPNSLDDFAEGLAELANHLIREKQYTCVKWLCFANEPPGGTWGYWWSRGADNAPFSPAFNAVRAALDQRGLVLPLSGPDWTDLPKLVPIKIDFAPQVGAYDLHSYGAPNKDFLNTVTDWAKWSHQQGKPFFLTELGDMSLGWGTNNPGPKSFAAVLSVAEKILCGLNAGVDGFNRWSFLNRGDQDGQWQLVRTWDLETQRYLHRAEPEPVPFYGYAMLTRFTAKYSHVLPAEWKFQTGPANSPLVFAAALRSPKGQLTLILLNRENAALETQFRWPGLDRKRTLCRYELTEENLSRPRFKIAPAGKRTISPADSAFTYAIPARSLVVFSTYELLPEAQGITDELP